MDAKEKLEELARNSVGLKSMRCKLLEPLDKFDNVEVFPQIIGGMLQKIVYCAKIADDSGRFPKECVDGKYRQIVAVFENNEMKYF